MSPTLKIRIGIAATIGPRAIGIVLAGTAALFSVACSDTANKPPTPAYNEVPAPMVTIDIPFNYCPQVTSLLASPLVASFRGKIDVSAAASDTEGGALTFSWTATGGSFDAPQSAKTRYNCDQPGLQALTMTVSDGQCPESVTYRVVCRSLTCGNTIVDSGEECDEGAANGVRVTDRCSTACILNTVCGDKKIEKLEQCDPPNGVDCSLTCTRIYGCGNGTVEAPEICDHGPQNGNPGDTCGRDCQLVRF